MDGWVRLVLVVIRLFPLGGSCEVVEVVNVPILISQ